MHDPVTGYTYPDLWITACRDQKLLALAEEGRGVLTASGMVLRRGYTTGTTAAAACGAAVRSLTGPPLQQINVCLPCRITVPVPVTASGGCAVAHKYAGDYTNDITANIGFHARAFTRNEEGHTLIPGKGIGRFVRDTARASKGDVAISPPSRSSIDEAISTAMAESGITGVNVTLDVPDGQTIGEKTLNPKIGVEGGISILGSTGFVEPWDDHLSESAFERIRTSERVVLTTGRTGLRYSRLLFPDHDVVLVGVHIARGIEEARGEVVLCGLPALILKYIQPGILKGTGYATVEDLSTSPSWNNILLTTLDIFTQNNPGVKVVLVNRDGTIAGETK